MVGINLSSRYINQNARPYVIAEIGVNHEGSFETAIKLINQAKAGGADAAKFQTYKAGRLAAKNSPAYWDTSKEPTTSQFQLFQKYDSFGPDEYSKLAQHCTNIGIDFLSTPFDAEAVEFLDPLMAFFKIASADITNVPLLRQIAAKRKSVLLSTGAATIEEIRFAVDTLREAGCSELALLHCILNYPCLNANANLNMILDLREHFPNLVIGYSDHTLPDPKMIVLTSAWLKGATILEKHFTYDKSLPGNDHYHAMDESDLRSFCENVALIEELNGQIEKTPLADEEAARLHARRSIVIDRPMKSGQKITKADITYKRPAHGISPKHWDEVIGKKITRDLEDDHILTWDDID